jgi:carbonic anhydrase
MMNNNRFATAINCMDGRVQIPVIEYLKTRYDVDYVDMVTEPGPIKAVARDPSGSVVASIRHRVEISVFKHHSKLIAVVGHHDCAGNPVDKETQLKQIHSAVKTVASWDFQVRIIGLWVDENWNVSDIS